MCSVESGAKRLSQAGTAQQNKGREAETQRMASTLARDGIQTKVALFKLGVAFKLFLKKRKRKKNMKINEISAQD